MSGLGCLFRSLASFGHMLGRQDYLLRWSYPYDITVRILLHRHEWYVYALNSGATTPVLVGL